MHLRTNFFQSKILKSQIIVTQKSTDFPKNERRNGTFWTSATFSKKIQNNISCHTL